ncbi:uncharacterized protein [Haliotis cracherodii]|uniref:uncharacterized protein n=1 Tax=Haliotis cracherodii TaxID=6455 RepID=UPI0039EBA8AE
MSGRTYCCVVGCSNYSGKVVHGRTVSLHRFPSGNSSRNRKLKSIWSCRLGRKNFTVRSWTRLCSEHFEGRRGPTSEVNLPSIFHHKVFKSTKLQDLYVVTPDAAHEERENSATDSESEAPRRRCPPRLKSHSSLSSLDVSVLMHDYVDRLDTEDIRTVADFRHQEVTVTPCAQDACTQTNFPVSMTDNSHLTDNSNSHRPWLTVDDLTDAEMLFYTGLPDKNSFTVLFDELTEDSDTNKHELKPHELTLKDQFFMVLMRLRLGLLVLDLAKRFRVSASAVSSIFNSWIDKMYFGLSFQIYWPSQETVRLNMPESCQSTYPTTRVVIACTEVYTETPDSLGNRTPIYSDYRRLVTWKVLVGTSPSGVVTYVSDLWAGSISDKQITEESGFLNGLDSGDGVIADEGFQIADLLCSKNVHLIIPPKKEKNCKLTEREVESMRKIANLRIHVEKAIERIKHFRILQGVIPLTRSEQVSKIFYVCAALSNLQPPLVTMVTH